MARLPKLYKETSIFAKTKSIASSIRLLADSITSLVAGTETYTDPETGQYVQNTLSSKIQQTAGEVLIVAEAAQTDADKAQKMAQPNVAPWFSATPYSSSNPAWTRFDTGNGYTFTDMGDGWMRVQCTNTGSSVLRRDFYLSSVDNIDYGQPYTWLVEVRNNHSTGTASGTDTYLVQGSNSQFWGQANVKTLEASEGISTSTSSFNMNLVNLGESFFARKVKLSEAEGSSHWTGGTSASVTSLAAWVCRVAANSTIDYEIRISVYRGEYYGPYKPYVGGMVYASQAELKVANDEISTKVSSNGVISAINQSAESVRILANKVEIDGTAVFQSISSDVDNAITGKGYATTEQAEEYAEAARQSAVSSIPDNLSDFNNDLSMAWNAASSTAAGTADKVATCAGFELSTGASVRVRFSTANTSGGALTLNVNSTGAKQVMVGGSVTSSSNVLLWAANASISFTYDGTYWRVTGEPRTWYAASTTAAGTAAKVATIGEIVICKGAIASLQMTNANTAANPTLNVSSLGARAIYTAGARPASDSATNWSANSTIAFSFDGQYWRYDSEASSKAAAAQAAANSATDSKLRNYSTTEQMTSAISIVSEALSEYKDDTDGTLRSLQTQVDGKIEAWYKTVDPTTSNEPASTWNTAALKESHVGDLYYNVENGHSWRWLKSNSVYYWQQIPDSDAAAALAAARDAQTTANGKRRIFTTTPTAPYDVGDLWVDGSKIRFANAGKSSSQTYSVADWTITATDDTTALGAVEKTHRVYYRTNGSKPSKPTQSWVAESTGNVYDSWTTKKPPLAQSTAEGATKYLKLYTCEQRMARDGTIACTEVQIDDGATVIDGGSIIAHSITATAIATDTITIGQSQVENLTSSLNSKANASAIPTKVSQLSNDSQFATTTQVSTAKSEAISSAASDATTKANTAERNAKDAIPTDISELNNDEGFITSDDVPKKVSELENDSQFTTQEAAEAYTDGKLEDYSTSEEVSSEIATKVGKIKVGGRNLLLKTVEAKTVTLVYATSDYYIGYFEESDYGKSLTKGNTTDSMTVAFDWQTTSSTGAAWVQIDGYTITNIEDAEGYGASKDRINLANGSGHYRATFKLSTTQANRSSQRMRIRISGSTVAQTAGSSFTLSNLKFETGTRQTDWTPAPEDVESDIASVRSTAEGAAPKAETVKRTQRIYYRKSVTGKPTTPGTSESNWVTNGNSDTWTKYNAWSTRVPPMADSKDSPTKYIYLYTCEQYQLANGTVGYTSVLLDDSMTVIDGGNLVTGSVTATQIDATNLHVESANVDGSFAIGKITNLQTSLDGKQPTGDYATSGGVEAYVNSVSEDVNGRIDGLTGDVGNYVNDLSEAIEQAAQTATGFLSFDADTGELAIGSQGSRIKNVITNSMAAYRTAENEDVAYFGLNTDENLWEMMIETARILSQLRFGDFAWIRRDNGNMSLKWIGE